MLRSFPSETLSTPDARGAVQTRTTSDLEHLIDLVHAASRPSATDHPRPGSPPSTTDHPRPGSPPSATDHPRPGSPPSATNHSPAKRRKCMRFGKTEISDVPDIAIGGTRQWHDTQSGTKPEFLTISCRIRITCPGRSFCMFLLLSASRNLSFFQNS